MSRAITAKSIPTSHSATGRLMDKWFLYTPKVWFIIATFGQWLFAGYIISYYGVSALFGQWDQWNAELTHGHIAGETMNNFAVAAHLFIAAVLMIGGPLQFIPKIRNQWLSFHRWNGRLYALIAIITSFTGLYMVWTIGTVGDDFQHLSISTNAILIIICAAFTYYTVRIRKMNHHEEWAFRLYLVVNGVWFFRVFMMFWLAVHGGPTGFDPESFTGPFLNVLGISQYVLPLVLFQWYLYAKKSKSQILRFTFTFLLIAITLAMTVGIVMASLGMWFPHNFSS